MIILQSAGSHQVRNRMAKPRLSSCIIQLVFLDKSVKTIYLNCEDFKRHSFPNVLVEILDALFFELEQHLTGWFWEKKTIKRN